MTKYDETDDKRKKRRLLWIILAVCGVTVVAATGILIAFFSDVVSRDGTVKSGTLDITGTYAFTVNGKAAGDTIQNLNPGDLLVVQATITNVGNKSAWVRNVISFRDIDAQIQPFLHVYMGEFTLEDIADGTADEFEISLTESTVATSGNMVLDGMGDGAETETGNDYEYLNSNAFVASMTIYFDSEAGNSAQNRSFGFTAITQALQFRNNNAAEPLPAAWDTVVTVPYGG